MPHHGFIDADVRHWALASLRYAAICRRDRADGCMIAVGAYMMVAGGYSMAAGSCMMVTAAYMMLAGASGMAAGGCRVIAAGCVTAAGTSGMATGIFGIAAGGHMMLANGCMTLAGRWVIVSDTYRRVRRRANCVPGELCEYSCSMSLEGTAGNDDLPYTFVSKRDDV